MAAAASKKSLSLSDWLCDTDAVYKDLFETKRRGWEDRSRDTRTYTYKPTSSYLGTLYSSAKQGMQQHEDVFYASTRKRFLDIGSAPGGTSKHLVSDLQWSGFAVSLSVQAGGSEMEFKHDSLKYRELDMSEADSYSQLSNWLDQNGAKYVDFVNMGVLALYTGDNDVHEEERAKFDERTQNNGQALHAVYRNSMCVALERLKEGGSIKWTLRESNLAEMFRVVDILAQLFDETRFLPCGRRSPFDLLCVGFRRDKALPVLEVIKRQNVPLVEQDAQYWKCELVEEAERIYKQHKTGLHVIWKNRISSLRMLEHNSSRQNFDSARNSKRGRVSTYYSGY